MPISRLPTILPWYEATPVVPAPVGSYMALIGGLFYNVLAGSVSIQNTIGQRGQGTVTIWSDLGVYWQYGTQFLLLDETGTIVFAGYTSKDKAYRAPGARQGDLGRLEHDLTLMDNTYRADKRRVFKSYLNTTADQIVLDLLHTYLAAEGVTVTSSSIATGPTVVEVIWSGSKSVSDALTWLATQAGYWWQIDLNGVLWFQPYGGVPAPFAVDGTNVDSLQELSVEFGNDMYVNRQFTKGSFAETAILTETFHGDGVHRSFTLSYPVSTVTSVVLDSVDVSVLSLKKGDSGGMFYYALGDAVLAQDPSQTILLAGDTLVVTYKGRYPVLASAQNSALITAQKARERIGSGIVENVYSDTKVRTLPAAFQIAQAMLSHYGTDSTLLTFTTRAKGLAPGQMLSINLSDFGLINAQMLVSSVTITDQADGINIFYTVAAVGSAGTSPNAPLESSQWQTYWQNLMAQSSDPSDFTDTQDTSLALLSSSVTVHTPHVTVTHTLSVPPICGVSMLCGSWTVA